MNCGPHGQTDDQTKPSGKTEPLPSNKNVGESQRYLHCPIVLDGM